MYVLDNVNDRGVAEVLLDHPPVIALPSKGLFA